MEVLGVRSIHVAIVIGVALTSPGQKMQGNQERVGDFSKQSDCPDSGHCTQITTITDFTATKQNNIKRFIDEQK